MDHGAEKELEWALGLLEKLWTGGDVAREALPGDPAGQARLEILVASITEVQSQALLIAAGDLSGKIDSGGVLAEGLNTLRERLRELARLVRKVADGDLTQRADFLGEFAVSFNEMVRSMEDNRHRLRRREAELFSVNSLLQEEARERAQAQERLEVANKTLVAQLFEIQSLQAELREQAVRDSLTGLFNRRFLEETLERELSAAARSRSNLTIILLDLDFFKDFNDEFGHEAGDAVLRVLGSLLRGNTRLSDVACRYGGEEFILVLPGASAEIALERAEDIRTAFAASEIIFRGRVLQATLSAGVAAYPTHGGRGDELIRAADAALYGAKRSGRNRIVLAT